jgi:hypothetical protein
MLIRKSVGSRRARATIMPQKMSALPIGLPRFVIGQQCPVEWHREMSCNLHAQRGGRPTQPGHVWVKFSEQS